MVINSEEERLKAAKALIDLKIDNARIREEAEGKSFEQTNKYLLLEHDLVEAKTESDVAKEEQDDLKARIETQEQEMAEMKEEYVTLKANHLKLSKEKDAEQRRNEDLGLELLSLTNEKRQNGGLHQADDQRSHELQ